MVRWTLIIICLLGMATTKVTTLVIAIPLAIWIGISRKWMIYSFIISIPIIIYKYIDILRTSSISMSHWISTQTYATFRLMIMSFTGQNLSIDHSWWLVSQLSQIISVGCLVVIIILILLKKSSDISLGLGWWFIAWSPRLFAHVNLGWIREHHAYVPLVGLCIAFYSLLRYLGYYISRKAEIARYNYYIKNLK